MSTALQEVCELDQADQRKRQRTRIGTRLWTVARTTALVTGLGLIGVLFVDLPASSSANTDPAKPTYVPASGPWIKLGADREDAQRSARATPEKIIGVQVASLGDSDAAPAERSSIAAGSVRWGASPSCLDARLRTVIYQVAANYGPVKVNSTCRSRGHNAKVGGATRSKHLTGDAADFSISRKKTAVLGWLRRHPSVGGLKLYGGDGHFHIDTGPRRTW
jgi:hypothetical protein